MPKGFFSIPHPKNEPVLTYAPGSKERAALKKAVEEAGQLYWMCQCISVAMKCGVETRNHFLAT